MDSERVAPVTAVTPAAVGPLGFRAARGTGGRAALEVLDGDEVIGAHVDTAFTASVLGALRGRGWAVVWGRVERDGEPPAVVFTGPGRRRRATGTPARVVRVGERFWVASASGEHRVATVSDGARAQEWRLGAYGNGAV
ncbi:hypothetical protein [Streptomyces sp. ICBB 8177]|uniref:hypothetical protein n=1 Tax=Streptomyces sp. ICBB 8177 TaxID=563922 RepID=UPI000D677C87|nr:hypothetical protein [Streptomyces sp. ICBB 8177]PWI43663.1 hypothetical protein CK485_16245 [Streptomyces sp. ICBB 8177]